MIQKKVLAWRGRQRRGSIMKATTFKAIQRRAMKRYHIGKARAAKVAGAAYWRVVRAKAK